MWSRIWVVTLLLVGCVPSDRQPEEPGGSAHIAEEVICAAVGGADASLNRSGGGIDDAVRMLDEAIEGYLPAVENERLREAARHWARARATGDEDRRDAAAAEMAAAC